MFYKTFLISIRDCFVIVDNDAFVINNFILFLHAFGLNFFCFGVSGDSERNVHGYCRSYAAFGTKKHHSAQ